jgi:tetratricopeptide (TPR) repeat protein
MRQNRSSIIILIILGVVSFMGGILGNIATGVIPEIWTPYIWLAWPLTLIFAIVSIGLTIWQARLDAKHRDETASLTYQPAPKTILQPPPPSLPKWTRESSPLIGREQELDQLQKAWRSVEHGSGGAVFVIGSAGAGKTRLIQSFLSEKLVNNSFWLLSARAFDGDQKTSYLVIREILEPLIEDGIIPSELVPEELAVLEELVPGIKKYFPQLPEVTNLEPEQNQIRLRFAVTKFILALPQIAPVVLYIDDLQWADRPTLDWLQHLLTKHTNSPVLLLATLRTEDIREETYTRELRSNLHRSNRLTSIVLDFLSEEEHRLLLNGLSGLSNIAALNQQLYDQTEGNPFFTLETIQMLFDQEILSIDQQGKWITKPAASILETDQLPIPESISAVIQVRLKGIGPAAYQFLQAAAVIGRDFSVDLAAEVVAADDQEVDSILDELIGHDLLRDCDIHCDFTHGILRDVIYQNLRTRQQRRLHRQVAETMLKTLVREPTPLQIQQLAHHFYIGKVWQEAFSYQLQAGMNALGLFDTQTALDYLETAQQIAEEQLLEQLTNPQRLAYLEALGDVYRTLGKFEIAQEKYLGAVELASDDPGKIASLYLRIGVGYERQTRYDQAEQWLQRAMDALDRQQSVKILAEIYLQRGMISVRRGDLDRAFEWANQALISENAQTHNLLGVLHRARGEREKAIDHLQQAIAIATRENDLGALNKAYTNLGVVFFETDRWDDARQANGKALEMSVAVGDAYFQAMILGNLSDIERHLGNLSEAMDQAQTSLKMYQELQSAYGEAHAHLNWGAALLKQGYPREARQEHLEIARKILVENNISDFQSEVARRRAECFLGEENLTEAESAIDRSIEIAQEHNDRSDLGSAKRIKALILNAKGDRSGAAQTIQESLDILAQSGSRYELGLSHAALVEICLGQAENQERVRVSEMEATQILTTLGAKLDLERIRRIGHQR